MKTSEDKHGHSHSQGHGCSCGNGHQHGPGNDPLSLLRRWVLSILIVVIALALLRPFIISQMLVRVTSYSTSSYGDAIRLCKKIIAIDKDNKQAWVSLGYAYMDISCPDMAVPAFEKVLAVYPQDRQAASFELGQAYYLKKDYAKAIYYFERVRDAGARAAVLLEADVLKYRHGTIGFRSLNSMGTLLGLLHDCYEKTGDTVRAAEVQKEYDFYKEKHSRILF